MNLIERFLNSRGYYKLVSSKYYKTVEDEHIKIAPIPSKNKSFNEQKVQKATQLLLEGLGEDINRPGLKDTPKRVVKYWKELTEGSHYTNKEIAEMYKKDFQVSFDPIVFKTCENIFSHCEHHLALMYNGTVYVQYIPKYWNGKNDKDGYKVIGLSKIPRIVEMCAKRLQLQEKLAADIAECIELATGSDEVYVVVVMDHGCVSARGVKSSGVTITPYMSAKLRNNKQARLEMQSNVLAHIKNIN